MTPEEREPARIFIVSEPGLSHDGLRALLNAEPGFCVVGTAADCEQALPAARRAGPDILLLDVTRPLGFDSEALGALAVACAGARIVLLVPSLDADELLEALKSGVRGVLMKNVSSDVLFRSIRAVAAGQSWIGGETAGDLVQSLSALARSVTMAPARKDFGLSSRELDVVGALAVGCANKEIAKRFAISEKTVKHHLTRIFHKLGLSNRLELALFALHHGLAGARSSVPNAATVQLTSTSQSPDNDDE